MPIAKDFVKAPYIVSWGKKKETRAESEARLEREERERVAALEAERASHIDDFVTVMKFVDYMEENT